MFNPATDKCPKHPRYQAKRAPTTRCWHCLRIWNYTVRAQMAEARAAANEEEVGCSDPIDYNRLALEEGERLPPAEWAFAGLKEAGIEVHYGNADPMVAAAKLFLEEHPEAAEIEDVGELSIPDENDGMHLVTYCRETSKPYGASFVCPWSHVSGRRLPRAVAANRDHVDCMVQCHVRITQDGRWYNLLTDCPVPK